MPPNPKFTRDEIAAAAFEIIKKDGVAALTARDLGKALGTSARPIFTAFKNMDEVKQAARELALAEFNAYISDYREYTPAFKRLGMMVVKYAIHAPELFKLLFMQEHTESQDFANTMKDLGDVSGTCIDLIRRDYGIGREEAILLFEQLWVNAFGLGAMCVMKVCNFSEEEIGRRLGMQFMSMMMLIKSGKMHEVYTDTVKNGDGLYHGHRLKDIPGGEEKAIDE